MDGKPVFQRLLSSLFSGRSIASYARIGIVCASIGLPMGCAHMDSVHPRQITGSIETSDGYLLSARNNGGIAAPRPPNGTTVLRTDAKQAGPSERFSLIIIDHEHFALKTADGHYLTIVGGVEPGTSSTATAIGTVKPRATPGRKETFTIKSSANGMITIQTQDGHFVTAVNGSGVGSADARAPGRPDSPEIEPSGVFRWLPQPGPPSGPTTNAHNYPQDLCLSPYCK